MINYQTKKLGEVCEVSSGNSAPQKDDYFQDGGFPFFRTSDVGSVHVFQNLCDTRDYLNEKGIKGMTLYKQGTILFPKSGASTFLNHRVMMGCDGYVSSHLATIKANNNLVDEKYLFHFLLTVDAKEIGANSAYPSLKVSDISNIEIFLPPLSEQKKIVKILDEKMGKITGVKKLREEALVDTEKIISRTLHEIFEEGKKKGWEEKELGKVCKINPGKDLKNLTKNDEVTFIPMRAVDEYDQEIKFPEIRKIKDVEKGYTYFTEKDVLFAKITPCMENGKVAIARNLKNKIGFGTTEFHVLRANIDLILPEFVYEIIRSKAFRLEAEQRMTGSAGQKRVPKDFLEKYKILLPSLSEQQKIVKKLDELSAQIRQAVELQKFQLEDLKKLEKAYLREAFNSELV